MKQYVTRDQFQELTDEAKGRWISWAVYRDGAIMPSIEQMAAFLGYMVPPEEMLCDVLWEETKSRLCSKVS